MKLIKTEDAVGHVLCHDITQIIKGVTKDAVFRKGHVVKKEDIPVLLSVGKEHLYVWEKDDTKWHENEAAEILYDICAGANMHPSDIKEGKIELITDGKIKKGDVLAVAQVAGIMAAKKTWEIIPMCHPLLLTGVDIHFELHPEVSEIEAIASVRTTGKTGIEMEALHAVSAALLTIYDMCKAVDRGMVIKDILLLEKDGGKSGHYVRS